MRLYIDTGVLVKLYYPEPESELLEAWLHANPVHLLFTPFHRVEMTNALALKVYRAELDPEAYSRLIDLIRDDVASGVLEAIQPDSASVLVQAATMAERHTSGIGARSLDVIHVATAHVLACASFLSGDSRQLELAAAAGMTAIALESLRLPAVPEGESG